MIFEVGTMNVRAGSQSGFERAWSEGAEIIRAFPGCISVGIERCVETDTRYLVRIAWDSLEAHVTGYRGSPASLQVRELIFGFLDGLPEVAHYHAVS
jgi:heme-degrading monooxygenase HmoA